MNDLLTPALLGILEGLTEFLPVSSTGHLILAQSLFGYDPGEWAQFNIVIQLGAIMAVVVTYRQLFWDMGTGVLRREPRALRFTRNVLIAFLPAAVIGMLAKDAIDAMLESPTVVAIALVVGGIAILLLERLVKPKEDTGVEGLSARMAIGVGLAQCLAMIPGTSRSGATIMGAVALGIDRKTAADFSFFLAVPTLAGATVLQLAKHHDQIQPGMIGNILIGAFVSFLVAVVVVKLFVAFVQRHGFTPFGWYRIIAGGAALAWLAAR